jgi:transposase
MYSYDKIKSVLVIYNTRLKYELTIDDILKIMQIARSTLYNWINKFSFFTE